MSTSVRDRIKLAILLEKQGARVRPTKGGFIAFGPAGVVTWHQSSSSDSARGDKNLMKMIERAGLTWPFDR